MSKVYQLNIIKKIKKDNNKKARKRYQNLSNEEKEKKWQYARERYKYLSYDEKQSFLSIENNILEREKMPNYNNKKQLF